MAGRKRITVDGETHSRLSSLKRDGESWDGCLNRLADEAGVDVEAIAERAARRALEQA